MKYYLKLQDLQEKVDRNSTNLSIRADIHSTDYETLNHRFIFYNYVESHQLYVTEPIKLEGTYSVTDYVNSNIEHIVAQCNFVLSLSELRCSSEVYAPEYTCGIKDEDYIEECFLELSCDDTDCGKVELDVKLSTKSLSNLYSVYYDKYKNLNKILENFLTFYVENLDVLSPSFYSVSSLGYTDEEYILMRDIPFKEIKHKDKVYLVIHKASEYVIADIETGEIVSLKSELYTNIKSKLSLLEL